MPQVMIRYLHSLLQACGLVLLLLAASSAWADTAATVPLPAPEGEVVLLLDGNIRTGNSPQGALFDLAMLAQLPSHRVLTATAVTDGVKIFTGPLVRDLIKWVGASGNVVTARALNEYQVDIPVSDFYDYDVLLATHMDGLPLDISDKGPLWLVYPRDSDRQLQDIRYDYRWIWQLKHLHFH